MGKRPRIKRETGIVVNDEKAFDVNIASVKARKIIDVSANIDFELWFDKHYLDRIQHGDENGVRPGIEEEKVQRLITQSVPHLLYYSSVIKGFQYANHNLAGGDRALRFVLQDSRGGDAALNVVLEVHVINLARMEITVKTAMSKSDFVLSDGQYALELTGKNHSVLRMQRQKNRIDVADYSE